MLRTKTNARATTSPSSATVDLKRQRFVPKRDTRPTRVFAIQNGDIRVCAPVNPKRAQHAGSETFASERELARLSIGWPISRFVEIWNRLPGVKPVRQFTDRKTAVRRIWKTVQDLKNVSSKQTLAAGVPSLGSERPDRLGSQKHTPGRRTKAEQIIALLKRPSGATISAMMAATGWQAHSVRGFISGQLRKKMGLQVKSFQCDDVRVYAINSMRSR